MTTSMTKRTYKRKKTRMGFGSNGWATLKLCYQLGGLTAEQHARIFETENVRNSYRILGNLADQRLLEQAPVQTGGRPKDFHFLSKANGSRGILLGGYEADIKQRDVLPGYKRFQLPQAVEHRHSLNSYLLGLREAAADDPDVEVLLEGLWGESNPAFPLRGAVTKKSDRALYEKIYPDGIFEVRFSEGLDCRYYLEFESRSRPSHVLEKLDAYAAHFQRLLKEDPEDIRDWLRPLIFLFSRDSTAVHVARTLVGAQKANAPELQRFFGFQRVALRKGIHAGRLVMFASLEDIDRRGVFKSKPGVLEKYPDDSSVAGLREVAGEVARVTTPKEKKS